MSAFTHHEDGMADLSQYFDLNQAAASMQQAHRGKTTLSQQQFTVPSPENALIQPQHIATQFQGPSHNYGSYQQHSSMPSGVMQNLMASQRSMLSGYGGMGTSLTDINENDGNMNLDLDFNDFLDMGDGSPIAQPVTRPFPGMHQQAAEKQQQERQKRLQQQQQQQAQQQFGHQRRASQGRNRSVDPLVDERISQILKQMRNSAAPANSSSSDASQTVHTQHNRSKKDEEDMDDDERLLASEEGKKLSSKERRQLRNKVSARAFRSRRKEYISQLEGEINAKSAENDDLRHDNELLRGENAQLTDLARMLLSQPAFNNVLEDLSSRGAQIPFVPSQNIQQPAPQQQQQQQQQHRASIAMSQASTSASNSQPTPTAMDFASTPIDGWNTGISAPEFNFNPSVFSVTELPEHPAIQPEVLAGKSTEAALPATLRRLDEKETYPVIERGFEIKSDRPTIASKGSSDGLFDDRQAFSAAEARSPLTEQRVFGGIPFEKACARIELISFEEAARAGAVANARFDVLCERLNASCERISRIIGDF